MLIATSIISILIIIGIVTSVIFYPNIKLGKIKIATFWVIALLGAIILLCIGSIPIKDVYHSFISTDAVNPLKILVLFLSITFLSIYLDEFGFFKWVANKFANKFSKNQYSLFFGLYLVISILTVFTSNDIIILTFTPFICYFCKRCKIKALPYLIMEFVAANTWSMCLIIGNPTNIYLTSSYNIEFFDYFLNMIIPTLGASLISLLLLFLVFNKHLKEPIEVSKEEPIKLNKTLISVGLSLLSSATVMLAISGYINIPMWIVAISFAGVELIFIVVYSIIKKTNCVFQIGKRLPWNLIPFVLSMFVIVLSLGNVGVLNCVKDTLNNINPTFSYGLSGVIVANLVNNIPMSVLYSSILSGVPLKAIYASIIASNIAAYITPIGALAGIMFMELTKSLNSKISFLEFLKYGVLIGLPTLLVSITMLEFLVK